jgi:hypothetical protein
MSTEESNLSSIRARNELKMSSVRIHPEIESYEEFRIISILTESKTFAESTDHHTGLGVFVFESVIDG